MLGNTIDIQSGLWTDQMTGLGAGIDSLYEYIFKVSSYRILTSQSIFDILLSDRVTFCSGIVRI